MIALVALVIGLGAGLALVAWFIDLERRDRPEVVLGIVLGVVLVEALLYTTQHMVPPGLFRLSVAGFSLRLPMVLVPAALAARVLVHGLPRRISGMALAWTVFFVWYASAAITGKMAGRPTNVVLLEVSTVVYLGGAIALAAGIAPGRLIRPAMMARWIGAMALVAVVFIPLSLGNAEIAVRLPFLTVPAVGSWGADATTVIAPLAAIALVVEMCSVTRRPWFAIAALLLLLSPVAGTQRASLLAMATIAMAIALVAMGATWRERARTTPTEAALVVLGLVMAVLAFVVFQLGRDSDEPVAVIENAETVWLGETASRATDARRQLWDSALDQIAEKPVLGWGLGKQTLLVRPTLETTELSAHDIYLDLLLRTGVVGLGLFLVAVGATFVRAMRTWRDHPDRRVAALALGCAAGLLGLLAKGAVESILEQFRLMTLAGLLIGVIAATAGRPDEDANGPTGADRSEPVGGRTGTLVR